MKEQEGNHKPVSTIPGVVLRILVPEDPYLSNAHTSALVKRQSEVQKQDNIRDTLVNAPELVGGGCFCDGYERNRTYEFAAIRRTNGLAENSSSPEFDVIND